MLILVCLSEQGVHPRHIAWRFQSGVIQPDEIKQRSFNYFHVWFDVKEQEKILTSNAANIAMMLLAPTIKPKTDVLGLIIL